MGEYRTTKEAVIKELKRQRDEYLGEGGALPRAIGGPNNLTLDEMIKEIEQDTELGRKLVITFSSMRREFPESS